MIGSLFNKDGVRSYPHGSNLPSNGDEEDILKDTQTTMEESKVEEEGDEEEDQEIDFD